MSTILLSFDYDVFKKLERGKKAIEYRVHFPKDEVTAYFYVCRPIQAISGIAHFDNRIQLDEFIQKYAHNKDAMKILEEMKIDCNFAVPLKLFTPTNYLSLSEVKTVFPDFLIPRMYYFLDNKPELFEFLKTNIKPSGDTITFDLSKIYSLTIEEL